MLAHGLVQYAEECDAYVAPKSSLDDLLSNEFLRNLHMFDEWQHAKQAWIGDRDEMTCVFNMQVRDL